APVRQRRACPELTHSGQNWQLDWGVDRAQIVFQPEKRPSGKWASEAFSNRNWPILVQFPHQHRAPRMVPAGDWAEKTATTGSATEGRACSCSSLQPCWFIGHAARRRLLRQPERMTMVIRNKMHMLFLSFSRQELFFDSRGKSPKDCGK